MKRLNDYQLRQIIDITTFKRSEENLRQSEERFRQVVEAADKAAYLTRRRRFYRGWGTTLWKRAPETKRWGMGKISQTGGIGDN
jgi:PAS domain-containing protein